MDKSLNDFRSSNLFLEYQKYTPKYFGILFHPSKIYLLDVLRIQGYNDIKLILRNQRIELKDIPKWKDNNGDKIDDFSIKLDLLRVYLNILFELEMETESIFSNKENFIKSLMLQENKSSSIYKMLHINYFPSQKRNVSFIFNALQRVYINSDSDFINNFYLDKFILEMHFAIDGHSENFFDIENIFSCICNILKYDSLYIFSNEKCVSDLLTAINNVMNVIKTMNESKDSIYSNYETNIAKYQLKVWLNTENGLLIKQLGGYIREIFNQIVSFTPSDKFLANHRGLLENSEKNMITIFRSWGNRLDSLISFACDESKVWPSSMAESIIYFTDFVDCSFYNLVDVFSEDNINWWHNPGNKFAQYFKNTYLPVYFSYHLIDNALIFTIDNYFQLIIDNKDFGEPKFTKTILQLIYNTYTYLILSLPPGEQKRNCEERLYKLDNYIKTYLFYTVSLFEEFPSLMDDSNCKVANSNEHYSFFKDRIISYNCEERSITRMLYFLRFLGVFVSVLYTINRWVLN